MHRIIAILYALLFGGVSAVDRALGSFERVLWDLDLAVHRLGKEAAESIAAEDAAWLAYKRVADAEEQKQRQVQWASDKALNVRRKIAELIGGQDEAAA